MIIKVFPAVEAFRKKPFETKQIIEPIFELLRFKSAFKPAESRSLYPSPRFEFVHVGFATNPFFGFGVEEEWHSPTKVLVVFGKEFGVLLVVPRLEAFDFDSCFLFELGDEWFHRVTMWALASEKIQ